MKGVSCLLILTRDVVVLLNGIRKRKSSGKYFNEIVHRKTPNIKRKIYKGKIYTETFIWCITTWSLCKGIAYSTSSHLRESRQSQDIFTAVVIPWPSHPIFTQSFRTWMRLHIPVMTWLVPVLGTVGFLYFLGSEFLD